MEWVSRPALLFIAPALVASVLGFANVNAKDESGGFFLGFPSYWNIVAFYVVVWELSTAATTVLLLVLSVLVFVPIKYLYPSRTEKLWYVNMTLATLWLALWAAITASLPDAPVALVALSLVYVVYYVAVSLWLTFSPSSAHPASRSAAESAARPSNS